MKRLLHIIYTCCLAATLGAPALWAQGAGQVGRLATTCRPAGSDLVLKTTLVLDSLRLGANRQMVIMPLLEGPDGQVAAFRPVMLNGRRQHIYFQRNGSERYPDAIEVERQAGKAQRVNYLATLPYEAWMDDATLRFATDTCGCGNLLGSAPARCGPSILTPSAASAWLSCPRGRSRPRGVHHGQGLS